MSLNISTEKKTKNTIAFVYDDKKKVFSKRISYAKENYHPKFRLNFL